MKSYMLSWGTLVGVSRKDSGKERKAKSQLGLCGPVTSDLGLEVGGKYFVLACVHNFGGL